MFNTPKKPDMVHYREMQYYAECAYATRNVQLKRRWEGEKVVVNSKHL